MSLTIKDKGEAATIGGAALFPDLKVVVVETKRNPNPDDCAGTGCTGEQLPELCAPCRRAQRELIGKDKS